jgi:two-component system phosphate regulon response regulator PhoB
MQRTNATILVIDDCAPIAEIIASHLGAAGYRTRIARDGTEAQRALADTRPDCIVLDLMMPGMTGAEFLHALRRDPATSDIPVVLASARVGHHGPHFRSQMDADYVVGKPFTRQQIVKAVRTALARTRDGAAEAPLPPPTRIDARARLAAKLGFAGFSAH